MCFTLKSDVKAEVMDLQSLDNTTFKQKCPLETRYETYLPYKHIHSYY